ncbi:MAG TPA: 30S ribosomal protein S21 [Cytophagaceae bacterium]|jgi:ribosomal protein S21|nr:30S ribosomal protein S21 [Cytophagaceae bacterium]
MKNKKYVKKTFNKPLKGGDSESGSTKFDHIQPIQAEPLEIKVYNNFDKALRAFRALVQKERVLSIYKEKQSYEKPSDKKRRKRNEMKRKLLELNSKNSFHKRRKKDYENDQYSE